MKTSPVDSRLAGDDYRLRLICRRCGAISFWPETVTTSTNMPTCCYKELLILGGSKVYIPYISMEHPYMKINFTTPKPEDEG